MSVAGVGPKKTVGMVSLGCPKNLVDGEVMLGRLQGAGYELVAEAREADVIVVNTCAFIDRAKQESVDTILEDPGAQEEFLGEVSGWAHRYEAPTFLGEPKNLVKLRAFLDAKLPA